MKCIKISHLVAALALLTGWASAWAHTPPTHAVEQELRAHQVTEHVYVAHGPQTFPSATTGGFMNNPGFVLTNNGVVIVDPGSSVQIGRKLLKTIQTVTAEPVIAVFNTHVHGDHWLGNQAIREAYPRVRIYAHQRMIEHVENGVGQEWVALFEGLTEGATKGTRVTSPNVGLTGDETLQIGGLMFRVHHTGRAHSDNDIMVELSRDNALFAGDIITNQRVQSARPADSDIFGQIEAVKFALSLGRRWIIPGHGLTGGREIAEQQLKFLQDLRNSVQKHFAQGLTDYEMTALVKQDMKPYQHWYNFDELGRVISHVYLNVEARDFED